MMRGIHHTLLVQLPADTGHHGLYSSQLFVTEKLLSEYTESWGKRLHH